MQKPDAEEHFQTLFEYAPVSLWEEDYSGLKHLLDDLRTQGVDSLGAYLDVHPEFVDECMRKIIVRDVNQHTLKLFKAKSKAELLANLDRVFRDDMRQHFVNELVAHWEGDLNWSGEEVNYTLEGEPLDIILHWRILPGHERTWERVLVTIENITERKQAERRLRNLFEAAPISLWEEDYSALKTYFDTLRQQGVSDLQRYLIENPDVVLHCASLIRVLDVNQKTLELFEAGSKDELLENLDRVFRDEMRAHFAGELVDMWNGQLTYAREGINYALSGEPINIHLDWRLMPGHEQDFRWVLVAIQDITARKKAEDYLRYLGTHDVLTGSYNRAFFEETILSLEQARKEPISIIIADINGLKRVNDTFGHQAGDKLIRRAAEVLQASLEQRQILARIGGDEFAIIMPDMAAEDASERVDHIQKLIELNNKYYRDPELSISVGAATSQPNLSLEKIISLADNAMYRQKGKYYRRRKGD